MNLSSYLPSGQFPDAESLNDRLNRLAVLFWNVGDPDPDRPGRRWPMGSLIQALAIREALGHVPKSEAASQFGASLNAQIETWEGDLCPPPPPYKGWGWPPPPPKGGWPPPDPWSSISTLVLAGHTVDGGLRQALLDSAGRVLQRSLTTGR